MFEIAIYAENLASFDKAVKKMDFLQARAQFRFVSSRNLSRADHINLNLGKTILFLDHDCYLSEEVFNYLIKYLSQEPTQTSFVLAGLYADPPKATLLQKAHNYIANSWLKSHITVEGKSRVFLGGAFLIHAQEEILNNPSHLFWGAEDKLLAQQLRQQNFKMSFDFSFQIQHETTNSFKHFVKRAWLHGKNEVAYRLSDDVRFQWAYWLRNIGFQELSLVPLILVHFCIQKAAILFQQVRRKHK